jgi:hypothetical protein
LGVHDDQSIRIGEAIVEPVQDLLALQSLRRQYQRQFPLVGHLIEGEDTDRTPYHLFQRLDQQLLGCFGGNASGTAVDLGDDVDLSLEEPSRRMGFNVQVKRRLL